MARVTGLEPAASGVTVQAFTRQLSPDTQTM